MKIIEKNILHRKRGKGKEEKDKKNKGKIDREERKIRSQQKKMMRDLVGHFIRNTVKTQPNEVLNRKGEKERRFVAKQSEYRL